MERVEALDICGRCGGYCCLHVPGRLIPHDLSADEPLTEQVIHDALDSKRAVVFSSFINIGRSKTVPVFTLAARGVNRPPLSLAYEPTRCYHLLGERCAFSLELRPFECAMMVPAGEISRCGMPDDMLIEPYWVKYQDLLRTVIETRSGLSWRDEVMRQLETRCKKDDYANAMLTLVKSRGLAHDAHEADAIIASWIETLPEVDRAAV